MAGQRRFSGAKYANGNHKSQQKAYMQGNGRNIRLEADRLAAALKKAGKKKPGKNYDASHNMNGSGKHGWELASKNRGKSNRRKLHIT
jgi:hypothetical protein